jgi:hypothetical protein
MIRANDLSMLTNHTAYFDASGSRSEGPILAVGGAIASIKAWDEFDTHWKNILKKLASKNFT